MREEWRPVVGWEGLYSVSDAGRVRSEERIVQTSAGPRRYSARVRSLVVKPSGHLAIDLHRPGVTKRRYVHHLVLEAFVSLRPEGLEGLHFDDDPQNNTLSNLRWGTSSDNQYDSIRNGTHFQRRKTHCKRGHLLSGDNLIKALLPRGHRGCDACQRMRRR